MKIYVNTKFKPKILVNGKTFYCQIGINGTVPQFKKKEINLRLGKWKIKNFFEKIEIKIYFQVLFKIKL